MSNELTMFQPGQVPAHIAAAAGLLGENTMGRGITVPSLSPQGKVWTVSLDGQKVTLQKRDTDGEMVPIGVMRVVILDFAKSRGRTYYEGEYDPAKEAAPLCWSDDGVTPDSTAPQLQAKKCAECPMAVKGSKVTQQGKAVTACSQHRMLAVIPGHDLGFTPLRLKIAVTSDFDKDGPTAGANAQQGWYAFSNYLDHIRSMGVPHTAMIVTKMKFDTGVTYPKILFAVDRWLTPEELAQVTPLPKREDVQKLLGGTWTPAGPDGVKKDDTTAGAGVGVAATKPQVATEAAATVDDDDDGEIVMTTAPAAEPVAAEPAKPKAAKPKAQPQPAAVEAEAQPEVKTASDPKLAALLADWG